MLAGADSRGYGIDLPPAPREAASDLFVGIATALMIAVNVRGLGTLWAVLMVVLCLAIFYLGRNGLILRLLRQPILWVLPAIFALSFLWSDAWRISLSLGAQTLLTVLAAVTIAQCLTARQFHMSIFIATGITCFACILHGGKGPSAVGEVLVGFLGSKDAMALYAFSGAIASIALLVDAQRSLAVRACALVVGLMESYIALTVHATMAVVCMAVGIVLFFCTYWILSKLSIARVLMYWSIACLLVLVLMFSSSFLELFYDANRMLGKDATLTGRTFLWDTANHLVEQSPFVGHGYRAFWVGDSLEVRRLLFQMKVEDGRGFHFHQQFLEVLVDTGFLGLTVLVLTLMMFVYKVWRYLLRVPSPFAAYMLTMMLIYAARWIIETPFLPFSYDMMLFYGFAACAMRPLVEGQGEVVKA